MFTTHTTFVPSIEQFMHKVYAWMAIGLAVTALSAYGMVAYPAFLIYLLSSKMAFYGLIAAQFGLVIYLSAALSTMSYRTVCMAFLLYSLVTGITLAPLFLVYTLSSIYVAFASTACMFGGMALYGSVTRTDLTKFGPLLIMALWGLIGASLLNWFFASSSFDYVISWAGVILFTALTAYDVQKIKMMYNSFYYQEDGGDLLNRASLMGALVLYLDFINLFVHIIHLMGKKRK